MIRASGLNSGLLDVINNAGVLINHAPELALQNFRRVRFIFKKKKKKSKNKYIITLLRTTPETFSTPSLSPRHLTPRLLGPQLEHVPFAADTVPVVRDTFRDSSVRSPNVAVRLTCFVDFHVSGERNAAKPCRSLMVTD